jgi:outer membrane receptor protein involved in Fe transport
LESRLGFRVHTPTVNPWWQVEFSARVVAGQNNVASELGEVPTPGFTVFTIRGFVKLRDQWLFTAGVDNLGNKNYREHLDPIAGNLLGVGPLFRPGTSFTFGIQRSY